MTYSIEATTSLCDSCGKWAKCLFPRTNSWLCHPCYSAVPNNVHEHARRVRKAFQLSEVMKDVTPEIFNQMGEAEWALVARQARVGVPSLETRHLVAYTLERAARRRESSNAA